MANRPILRFFFLLVKGDGEGSSLEGWLPIYVLEALSTIEIDRSIDTNKKVLNNRIDCTQVPKKSIYYVG